MTTSRLCSLALLIGISVPVFSQTYFFDNYSVRQGLAQSKVYAIIQDHRDYIWLGTEGGISRFDGTTFENFTTEDGLAVNGVQTILQDRNNNIWMGHIGGGITRYNGKVFERLEGISFMLGSDITSIALDTADQIWIATASSGALLIFNPGAPAGEFRFEQYSGRRLSDRVFKLYMTHDGGLFLLTDIGIQKFLPGENDFEKILIKGLGYHQVTSVIEDSHGNFWFGTYNDGLKKYDPVAGELTYFTMKDGLAHNFVSSLFEDSHGNIWVGTWGGGITRINRNLTNFNMSNGLQDSKIRCFYEDVEGNILIGTNENGLSIYKGEHFVSWSEASGLINNQVWAVHQDRDGKYWFGTNGGITVLDLSGRGGSRFRHLTSDQYTIGDQIRFIEEDRYGNIWLGTYANGTFEYNPKTDRFSYSFLLNSYNTQQIVTAMEIDARNNLWVGTTDGLLFYDIDTRAVQRLTQIHGLAGTDISALFADSRDRVWVGSKGRGLTKIEGDTAMVVDLGNNFTPTCITEDQDGLIWFGTEGQGVFAIESDTVKLHYSRQNGLMANLITLIEVDDRNNLYFGTNLGLNKLDREKDKIYSYTRKNGFVGIETKNNASCCDSEGNLWFGTVAGVTRYSPGLETRSEIDPLTHIINLRVNLEDRAMEEGMKLSFNENSIIFDYTSICLTNPDAVRYQYKLEGADVDWLPETEQTTATYPALKPGKYIFQVRARNSDGVWNKEPVSYAFQIRPPFYATWWFILTCVFVAGVVILLWIKWREQKLRRENRILEEKVRERTAVVVAQKEELAQKNKDITDSIRYAKRIQFAILPPEVPFKDTFILFKPKDIVSGDFYWLLEKEDREFIAAVDCTGHGVPGAFMSIIGHNMLNKIVKEYGVMKPAEILDHLDAEVSQTLRQENEASTVKDGMDMTLICFHREKMLLEFSGAYNPIYLIRNGELIETKGDRFAIGRSEGGRQEKKFTNHEIRLQKDDTIYMFSDGYADQFGGIAGKKFKSGPMKELLLNIHEEPIEKQQKILNATIEAWRGDIEQIDDILVIGRRF
jgi:ligand-binding sensor domain-containing protein/serine phosphatase RsbU (regulator of sigma subunit)